MADACPRTLDLPTEFIRLNEADPAWLRALPELVDALARRWSLALEPHFPEIAYNYVAPVTQFGPDGHPTRWVLKVSCRPKEVANEIAALRLWDGRGAARLIEADPQLGALLLERGG
jgi:streptomycin 6-kinase